MSEDLTKKLPRSESDVSILTAIKNLDSHVRSSIDNLVTWVSSIDSRLKNLEQKVEQRLYDTRPLWHKLDAHITQLQSDVTQLQSDVTQLQLGQDSLRAEVRDLGSAIDKRLHRLEVDRNPQNSST